MSRSFWQRVSAKSGCGLNLELGPRERAGSRYQVSHGIT